MRHRFVVAMSITVLAAATAGGAEKVRFDYRDKPLSAVLRELQGHGLPIVFSSAVVKPGMKVSYAGEADPREALGEILTASGLKVQSGPKDSLMVVSAALGAATTPGMICRVKVISDKVPDVSNLDAWKAGFIRDGMSDEEKAMAVWRAVFTLRHQDAPPSELKHEGCVHDPVKTWHVYGYGMCCCASSNIEALARYAGLQGRGRIITSHSVPEVFWDGKWRLLDSSLICYFPGSDGKPLGVDEMIAGLDAWYQQNPGFKGNDGKLREFMRGGGWRKGPDVFAKCPTYDDNGWLPAATHGWYSTMQEYVCPPGQVYEYGYSQGYEVNIRLRKGEKIVRNWSNKGLHVNMEGGGGPPGCLKGEIGKGDLRYAPKYGDIAPGRIGNGTHEYDAPLANGAFKSGALAVDNLACTADDNAAPALHVKDAAKPGIYVLRMPSSYVYLSGEVALKAVVGGGGGIAVSVSANNGLDWKDLATIEGSGERKLNIKPFCYRQYDYRLKFEMKGKGTGLEALKIVHDIQHSQRVLPALGQGSNTISFSSGPHESTVTAEASFHGDHKGKQLQPEDFHAKFEGVDPKLSRIGDTGSGQVTIPVSTPYDMTRLRFGCQYRARDKTDGWDALVSFDDGKTFKKVDRFDGPTPGFSKYITVSDIPAGTKSALVRWSGQQRNTTCMFQFRIDADHKEPQAGSAPVKITYVWDENGQEKKNVHVATQPGDTYKIECAGKPTMKSIALELAE